MDFTYLVAALLSLLIGVIAAIVFVLVNGRSYWKLLASAWIGALLADFALLLDWSRANEMTTALLLTDLAFFAVYGLVACAIGTLPVLGSRGLYRWAKRADSR